ncbi:MAG: hypothetical protein INH41_16745 [Myxococcaceae bacterium]|nr:hypothetical protein [Myxococcaceae bacterium]
MRVLALALVAAALGRDGEAQLEQPLRSTLPLATVRLALSGAFGARDPVLAPGAGARVAACAPGRSRGADACCGGFALGGSATPHFNVGAGASPDSMARAVLVSKLAHLAARSFRCW